MSGGGQGALGGFHVGCRRCPRLAGFLDRLRLEYPGYHARPVPSFGDPAARLLVVGLAPGLHGANRTGRPFTGDFAGILLYKTLYEFGFSTSAESLSNDDGLRLKDCRITNAVRCVPPANKPTTAEVRACNDYLAAELQTLPEGGVVVALGRVAHGAILRALGLRAGAAPFAHAARAPLPGGRTLLDSYHCSRYNTQTGRLSEAMFHQVFRLARAALR